ncbi:MAG: dickkopf-related protein [Myxococcota bacterium]
MENQTRIAVLLMVGAMGGCMGAPESASTEAALAPTDSPDTMDLSDIEAVNAVIAVSHDLQFQDELHRLLAVDDAPLEALERVAALSPNDPNAVSELQGIGLDPHVSFERRRLQRELTEYYGLSEYHPESIDSVFGGATAMMISNVKINGIEYNLRPIDETSYTVEDPECLRECNRAHAERLLEAALDHMENLDDCETFLCAIWESIQYVGELRSARREQQQCLDDCPDVPLADILCNRDADCAADEYCHFRGLNDCRPRRDQGALCTRHTQCATECCRHHIRGAGLKICRPSNRCD